MTRFLTSVILLASLCASAQDVFVPPVPRGIAREGIVRTPERPLPFPSEHHRWLRLTAGRFDIISSASPEATRDIATDFNVLASALASTSSRFTTSSARTTIFVFTRRRESQPYFEFLFRGERTRATGAYVRHDGGGTMFIDASHPRIEKTALHELVHDLLQQGESVPPLWVEEGLAEYFSTAVIQKGRVLAGDPIREHIQQLKARIPMKAEELFTATMETEAAAAHAFYAQSWAAVDWLMSQGHEKFYPFLADLERGMQPADALMRHYGKSIADLETAIRWRDRLSVRVILEGSPPAIPEAVPLERADLLYELGLFLRHVPGAEGEASRHMRAALAANPRHGRALAAIGRYEAAVAASPRDAEVLLLYAESLLKTALGPFAGIFDPEPGDAERFRTARDLASRALELKPHDARAHGIIGTSYLAESDFTPGIVHLERAHERLPQRMDFALNLYAMYLRSNANGKAEQLAATAFRRADRQTVFAAQNVRLAVMTDRANVLVRQERLHEAAAIVRELAGATPDPNAARELRDEAERIEALAVVNDHIRMYNRAVELSNTGDRRGATKLIDELLTVATDEEVVRDAKKLRRSLGGR